MPPTSSPPMHPSPPGVCAMNDTGAEIRRWAAPEQPEPKPLGKRWYIQARVARLGTAKGSNSKIEEISPRMYAASREEALAKQQAFIAEYLNPRKRKAPAASSSSSSSGSGSGSGGGGDGSSSSSTAEPRPTPIPRTTHPYHARPTNETVPNGKLPYEQENVRTSSACACVVPAQHLCRHGETLHTRNS